MITKIELAKYIDHTVLKADTSLEQIEQLCIEAKTYQFKTVCINPHYIQTALEKLKGSSVEVCTVIGFPLGASLSQTKAAEAIHVQKIGASEIDMVINISALKEKENDLVLSDIRSVVQAVPDSIVKVILETCLLSTEEISRASKIVEDAGAHFVKTSTGFSTGGATLDVVQLIKSSVSKEMKIKASGGIKNLTDALNMIQAGANRLGTSRSVKLISEIS